MRDKANFQDIIIFNFNKIGENRVINKEKGITRVSNCNC